MKLKGVMNTEKDMLEHYLKYPKKSLKKRLLFKDLCSRLPYDVKGLHRGKVEEIQIISEDGSFMNRSYNAWFSLLNFKPYLRPMSSMTEEEKYYLTTSLGFELGDDNILGSCIDDDLHMPLYNNMDDIVNLIDWLNAHHFDYRGLIEKGLALEAPKDMY